MTTHTVAHDEERPFIRKFILIRGYVMCHVVLVALASTPDIRQSSSRETKFLRQLHPLRVMDPTQQVWHSYFRNAAHHTPTSGKTQRTQPDSSKNLNRCEPGDLRYNVIS